MYFFLGFDFLDFILVFCLLLDLPKLTFSFSILGSIDCSLEPFIPKPISSTFCVSFDFGVLFLKSVDSAKLPTDEDDHPVIVINTENRKYLIKREEKITTAQTKYK